MKKLTFVIAAMMVGTFTTAAFADPAQGRRVFNKCRACHQIGDNARNGVGPNLNGLIGRAVASVDGYNYSDGMAALGAEGKAWTREMLTEYLKNPRGYVPGTKMAFAGLKRDKDIANILDYLEAQN